MADQKATYEIKLKDSFSKGLGKLDQGVDRFETNVAGATKRASGGFAALGKQLVGMGLAVGAGMLVKNIANIGIEMEQTRVSFTTFLGSVEKANKAISDLNEFSNVTPFDNAQVIKSGKVLLAFGVAQDALIPSLKKIGDISAGTGKDFNELSVIYGKAKIAGTLMAEDINQLVEAGVPIMGEFAKSLGVTEGEVKKMASTGALKFSHLEEAFTNLTSEGGMFFDLMAKQSQTVGGKLSTIIGKLQGIGITIGEALLPAMGAFADFTLMIVDNEEVLTTIGITLGIVTGGLAAYAVASGIAFIATGGLTAAVGALTAAMLANPVGLIVVAVGALTAGFVALYRHSQPVRAFFGGLQEMGKALLPVLGSVGNMILAIVSGDFTRIPSILKNLATNAGNVEGAFERGREKVIKEERKAAFEKLIKKVQAEDPATISIAGAASGVIPPSKTAATAKAKSRKGISSSISGSSPKNVTLNIDNVVKTINFNAQKMEKSTQQMTDMVKRALLTALNDVAIVNS